MHGSEACEHFFGVAKQINMDFTYADLIKMVSKIFQYSYVIRMGGIKINKR